MDLYLKKSLRNALVELLKQSQILQHGEKANVGFKDYDELIFNNKQANDSLSPFTNELWSKTMKWYQIFSIISGTLILIAVFILAFKMINAGMNTTRKNEVKENLMKLIQKSIIENL